MAKLTKIQKRALHELADIHGKDHVYTAHHIQQNTAQSLRQLGYTASNHSPGRFEIWDITPAGAAAIGREDLFATPAPEPGAVLADDLTDPDVLIDEPVPSKPIAVRVLDLIPRAEYDALKAQLATVTRERDTFKEELTILVEYVEENAFELDLPYGLRLRAKSARDVLNPTAEPTMMDLALNETPTLESLED